MGLCSWFGYPFDPTHWSLLQLLAAALISGAIRSILNPLAVDMITTIICLVLFLGLIGYFFIDDSMTSLIAILLIFAAHAMVTFLLMQLMKMILAQWIIRYSYQQQIIKEKEMKIKKKSSCYGLKYARLDLLNRKG